MSLPLNRGRPLPLNRGQPYYVVMGYFQQPNPWLHKNSSLGLASSKGAPDTNFEKLCISLSHVMKASHAYQNLLPLWQIIDEHKKWYCSVYKVIVCERVESYVGVGCGCALCIGLFTRVDPVTVHVHCFRQICTEHHNRTVTLCHTLDSGTLKMWTHRNT